MAGTGSTRGTKERTASDNRLSYTFRTVGRLEGSTRFEVYHALISMGWLPVMGLLIGSFMLINALFALGYLATGGLQGAQHGSFADAFFFSVQTFGTIGYGAIAPLSVAANELVVVESVVSLVFTAMATGLVFVRFSRVRGRIVFSRKATIGLIDGVPSITVRIGNGRSNRIFDADLRLMITRTRRTAEGTTLYATEDLKLVRSHAPTLGRSWMLMHRIDENSPLYRETPESFAAAEGEIVAAVGGIDDTALQPVHGRYTWEATDIVWGAKLADVLHETGSEMIMDLGRFHLVEPTTRTEQFPYP
jgi:inward rectifier potassium channel